MTRNFLILILLSSFVMSCIHEKKLLFRHYEMQGLKSVAVEYSFSMPKGYSVKALQADAEAGSEQVYSYPDSSLIYITDFENTVNIGNIRDQVKAYSDRFFSDSISLEGTDQRGKFWREIKYHGVFYGYSRASSVRKMQYDFLLESVRRRNK